MIGEQNMTTISNAVTAHTIVTFDYRSASDTTATTRRVQPFAVVRDDVNREFVLGYDVDKKGYRTYMASAINNLTETNETFNVAELNTNIDGRWKEVVVRG